MTRETKRPALAGQAMDYFEAALQNTASTTPQDTTSWIGNKVLGFVEEHGSNAWWSLPTEKKLFLAFEEFPDEAIKPLADKIDQGCIWTPWGLVWPSKPGSVILAASYPGGPCRVTGGSVDYIRRKAGDFRRHMGVDTNGGKTALVHQLTCSQDPNLEGHFALSVGGLFDHLTVADWKVARSSTMVTAFVALSDGKQIGIGTVPIARRVDPVLTKARIIFGNVK